MSGLEMGASRQEYQIGQDTIVGITSEKIKEMEASDMPLQARYDKMSEMHEKWDLMFEDLEKAQGN